MGIESKRDRPKKSARESVVQLRDKDNPEEYRDVIDDVHRVWTTWTAAPNTSELWRRIETSGLNNSLKILSKTRAELSILSSVSTDEAGQLTLLMEEFREMLNCIRFAFIDNEKDIFDSDERERRYLTITCPTLLEIWSSYSSFTSEVATRLTQKCWQYSSEHRDLLRAVVEVAASSVKLVVLCADIADYHSLEEAEALHQATIHEAEGACTQLRELVATVMEIDDNHMTKAPMLELSTWHLYGIWHIYDKVIKVGVEARAPDDNYDAYEELVTVTNDMLKQIKESRGEPTQEPEQTPAVKETTPEKKTSGKRKDKSNKKNSSKSGGKTAKIDDKISKQETTPVEEKKGRTKEECLELIQKVGEAYKKCSDDAWSCKRLPVLDGSGGVEVKYRMESYSEIGKVRIESCSMAQRKSHLDGLALNENHEMYSDIFTVTPEPLVCTQEVIVQFPIKGVAPMDKGILVLKLKREGKWEDIECPEQVLVEDVPYLVFTTKQCEGFAAVTFTESDTCVVTPTGTNYCSGDEPKVEVQFPEGTVDEEVKVRVKLLTFDKGKYESQFVGVVTASVGIELSPESEVTMKKQFSVQLPIHHDGEDKDTELVVARCHGNTVQILDKKQIGLRQLEHGLFTVEMKGFWCIAVLRIRRIFLNMRESIKKEFLVGYGKARLCNILTFIDHVTKADERQTFIMEIVEKCDVDTVVETKKNVGLIEIKKSRSKDVLVDRGEEIMLVVDGQIRSTEAHADENLVLCYFPSATNLIHVSTEIKRDPDKLPDAMLAYKRLVDDVVLHSLSIMTRDLAELPTEEITARTGSTLNLVESGRRDKKSEEAAANVLQMPSLMSLARELTFAEGKVLGEQLGVKEENIRRIKERTEKDDVSANFQILCDWRGRHARTAKADFLVSSLKAVGKVNYANIVDDVRRDNRGLERTDFHKDDKKSRKK